MNDRAGSGKGKQCLTDTKGKRFYIDRIDHIYKGKYN